MLLFAPFLVLALPLGSDFIPAMIPVLAFALSPLLALRPGFGREVAPIAIALTAACLVAAVVRHRLRAWCNAGYWMLMMVKLFVLILEHRADVDKVLALTRMY